MKNKNLICEFVELFLQTSGDSYALDVPSNMRKGEKNNDGWCEWKSLNR